MKRGLRTLLMADAWAVLALGMIAPIYAIFVEEIGGDILDASWAFFAFTFTSGIVMYLISRWEDHVNHKEKLVVIGYSLLSLGFFSYIFVYNQPTLLITQVVLGLGLAFLSPAYDAVYAHYINKREETSDWGSWEAMGYIVGAIAALIGGYVARGLGFRFLFVIMFAASLIGVTESLKLFKGKKYLNKR